MNADRIVVGLDVGTTKVATLVGELGADDGIRILGVGIEPSQGMHRGTVVDVAQATEAIRASKRQAERTSGFEIGRAFVSVAGKHIGSINSHGVAGLNSSRGGVTGEDIERALQNARAVPLPHNTEILHVIPRSFIVDGQEGIRNPRGLHAYRLEVEAHIITAAQSALKNLEKAVNDAGLAVDRFVLNPLASAEAILTDAERESGVLVVDIGGGTTDLAVFIDGTVWHTAVIEVGGSHLTSDVAQLFHLPSSEAERIKIEEGNARPEDIGREEMLMVESFGQEAPQQIYHYELAQVIEARVDEIFTFVTQELKRSGYDGLLPAGVVLTGGTAALRSIRFNASRVLHLPARVGMPTEISGLSDKLTSPAYATAVGLLRFARRLDSPIDGSSPSRRSRREMPDIGKTITDLFGRLLPGED